jgi:hypothetical protein
VNDAKPSKNGSTPNLCKTVRIYTRSKIDLTDRRTRPSRARTMNRAGISAGAIHIFLTQASTAHCIEKPLKIVAV